MRVLDYILLSVVLGLTAVNIWMLGSDYPENFVTFRGKDRLQRDAPKNTGFRHIVLHHLDRPHEKPAFPFHIVIGDGTVYADGAILPTDRWKDQTGSRTIDIGIAGGFTEKQQEALLTLLERLCFEYRIPPEEVGTHFEIDGFTECARNIHSERLRKILQPKS